MVFGNSRRERKSRFVSLAYARKCASVGHIQYTNPKIAKRLFWVGLVLPDFKISWGILLVYGIVKHPFSIGMRIRFIMRDIRECVYSVLMRRGYI